MEWTATLESPVVPVKQGMESSLPKKGYYDGQAISDDNPDPDDLLTVVVCSFTCLMLVTLHDHR